MWVSWANALYLAPGGGEQALAASLVGLSLSLSLSPSLHFLPPHLSFWHINDTRELLSMSGNVRQCPAALSGNIP